MSNDKVFKDVDRLRNPERIERLEVTRVVELCLEGLETPRILDVGTGSGLFAEAFSGKGAVVTGVDINPEMLEAARRHLPAGNFKEGRAEDIPFPDSSFELVFIGLVLHEVDNLPKALQEARRVTINRVAALEWPYEVQEFGPPLDHRLKPEELTELAEKAGFSRVEVIPLKNMLLYRMYP